MAERCCEKGKHKRTFCDQGKRDGIAIGALEKFWAGGEAFFPPGGDGFAAIAHLKGKSKSAQKRGLGSWRFSKHISAGKLTAEKSRDEKTVLLFFPNPSQGATSRGSLASTSDKSPFCLSKRPAGKQIIVILISPN
ncbi:MAG: hypothetical protein AAGN35_24805 [Bacteroidota bacterium]